MLPARPTQRHHGSAGSPVMLKSLLTQRTAVSYNQSDHFGFWGIFFLWWSCQFAWFLFSPGGCEDSAALSFLLLPAPGAEAAGRA